MNLYLAICLAFIGTALADCSNNCAHDVAGNRQNSSIASSDCNNFLLTTITPPASTLSVTLTSTVNATTTIQPVERKASGIPDYASNCKDAAAYSSACSCLGVTRHATITASVSDSTTTIITTITRTRTVPRITPTPPYLNSTTSATPTASLSPNCTADTSSDPQNCGSCGTVCSSGVCENGACTSDACQGQTCGDFKSCGGSAACFCFSSTGNGTHNGFCGQNAICSGLTACANDFDCSGRNSTGTICAVKTCCGAPSNARPGVCLHGTCGNPAAMLQMAAMAKTSSGDTAAFKLG